MLLFVGHVCVPLVCRVAFGEIILKCLIVGSRVHGRICAFGGIFDTALIDVLRVWYNSHVVCSCEGVVSSVSGRIIYYAKLLFWHRCVFLSIICRGSY